MLDILDLKVGTEIRCIKAEDYGFYTVGEVYKILEAPEEELDITGLEQVLVTDNNDDHPWTLECLCGWATGSKDYSQWHTEFELA